MTHALINPSTTSVPVVNTYLCSDHVPQANFNISPELTLDQARNKWLLKNTITDLIVDAGTQVDQHFFIFDHYLYLDGYKNNSCFFPDFFIHTAQIYRDNFTNQVNFSKKNRVVSCPMNKLRYNRILASCYFANQNTLENLIYTQNWASDQHSENLLYELLQLGQLNDWQNQGVPAVMLPEFFIPGKKDSHNVDIFQHTTFNIIHPAAISIVLEPIFWEPGCIITEKYLNAIYSGTIPIVDGYLIYDCLEAMGFDTFSDIVDTSSQYDQNPITRVWTMLQTNQTLFESGLDLINQTDIQERILNNIQHAQQPKLCLENFLKNGNCPDLVDKCIKILKELPTSFCKKTLEVYFNCNK